MTGLLDFICCFNCFLFFNIKYKSFLAGVELNFGIANRITGFRIFLFWSFLKVFKNYENCILVCVFLFLMWVERYVFYLPTVCFSFVYSGFVVIRWKKWKCSKRVYSKNSFCLFLVPFYRKKETVFVRVSPTCFNSIYVYYLSVACSFNCFLFLLNRFLVHGQLKWVVKVQYAQNCLRLNHGLL